MGTRLALTFRQNCCAGLFVTGSMFVAGLVLLSTLAIAQDQPAPNQKPQQSQGFFGSVGRWLEAQTANMGASFNDARKRVEGFGNAAGDAAKTTVEGAKDAADAVVRIPTTRAISARVTSRATSMRAFRRRRAGRSPAARPPRTIPASRPTRASPDCRRSAATSTSPPRRRPTTSASAGTRRWSWSPRSSPPSPS